MTATKSTAWSAAGLRMLLGVARGAARHQGVLAGTAVAGAVAGHDITYVLTVPDPHARDMLLGETGHSHWFLMVAAAVVLGAAALGVTLTQRFLAGCRGHSIGPDRRLLAVTRTLAVTQVAIFVAQEITERLAVGAPLDGHFREELAAGVAVQVVVAFLAAALLAVTGRSAEAIGRALRRRTPAPRRSGSRHRWSLPNPPAGFVTGSARSRAPPLTA